MVSLYFHLNDPTESFGASSTGPVSKLGQLHTQALDILNYRDLAHEHSELIRRGKTSLEIAMWLGEKLGIESWKSGAFPGLRKVLTTPRPEEISRLRQFTQALDTSWTKANTGSDNHPQFLLLDGYVQNALFGQTNITRTNKQLDIFNADWKRMGKDYTAKEIYLNEKIGLDIKGDWSKLTGIRYEIGVFTGFDELHVAGSPGNLNVNKVRSFLVFSFSGLDSASSGRLCLLA